MKQLPRLKGRTITWPLWLRLLRPARSNSFFSFLFLKGRNFVLFFFIIEVENVLAVGSRNWAFPNTFRICRKRKFVCLVGFSKRQIFGVSYFWDTSGSEVPRKKEFHFFVVFVCFCKYYNIIITRSTGHLYVKIDLRRWSVKSYQRYIFESFFPVRQTGKGHLLKVLNLPEERLSVSRLTQFFFFLGGDLGR